MKSFSCTDLGSTTCNFVAMGKTEGEVIGKMKAMGEEGMNGMMKPKVKTA